jgi:hypothetical protein
VSSGEEAGSATLRRIQRRRKIATIRKTIVASALLTAALATYCYVGRLPDEIAEPDVAVTLAEHSRPADTGTARNAATPTARPSVPAVPIDQSDPFVRQLMRRLSANPRLAAWLVNDDLIRRFAASVANIAEGVSPRKQLEFLAPKLPYRAVERDDRIFVDPRSAERYDDLAETFASLRADGAAAVYRELRPLLARAYVDLGYPDTSFDDALRRAIEELWHTPRHGRQGDIELIATGAGYEYADPELEGMSGAQKQLFRMGSRNQQLMRDQVLAIALELDLVLDLDLDLDSIAPEESTIELSAGLED